MCPDRLFGLGDAADYLWGSPVRRLMARDGQNFANTKIEAVCTWYQMAKLATHSGL